MDEYTINEYKLLEPDLTMDDVLETIPGKAKDIIIAKYGKYGFDEPAEKKTA